MAAGGGDIRLDDSLIQALPLLMLHDEQVAPREGDDVILEVDEDVIAFVKGTAADHS